jgi:hypothetical protein
MRSAEEILEELKITQEVLNIYPYGSQVYGTSNENSDEDYIIVTKSAFLDSGAFKDNAISNHDYSIQGVLYSRTGFIDAINNYDIAALECLFLPEDKVIQRKWPFKIQKFDEKEMTKKIIRKISASWHIADIQAKDDQKDRAKKGIFHALRILHFGLQLKEHHKIVDYSISNELKRKIDFLPDYEFDTRDYIGMRDELMAKLRE